MNSVSFKSLLYDIATKMGHDPQTVFPIETQRMINTYINHALESAWLYYLWPELMRYSDTLTADDQGLINLSAIDYGTVFAAYTQKPTPHTQQVYVIHGYYENGSYFLPTGYSEAVLHYRLPYERFDGDVFSDSVSYQTGDQAYFTDEGNYKKYDADTDTWTVRQVPAIFGEYVRRHAYANYLREQQRPQEAATEESLAKIAIQNRISEIQSQTGNVQQIHLQCH